MSTFDWLKRAGLPQYASQFEDAGLKLVRDVISTCDDEGKLRQNGVHNGGHCALLLKLIQNKDEHKSVTVGILCPDKASVAGMFWAAYGKHLDGTTEPATLLEAASEFARRVTDRSGRSLVSTFQLQAHFRRCERPT